MASKEKCVRGRAGRYWNLLSRYIMAKIITVLHFTQSEANYMYNRVHYSSGYIYSYALHEVYIHTFLISCSHYIGEYSN